MSEASPSCPTPEACREEFEDLRGRIGHLEEARDRSEKELAALTQEVREVAKLGPLIEAVDSGMTRVHRRLGEIRQVLDDLMAT